MKFIPELAPEKFWAILQSHPRAAEEGSLINWALANVAEAVQAEVFAYEAPYTQINFPEQGGITAYFSRNMTDDDLVICKDFL